jgi:hypothetical protein
MYYLLMIFGQGMGRNEIISPLWASWLPNLVLGGIGLFMFIAGNRESWLPSSLLPGRKRRAATAEGVKLT